MRSSARPTTPAGGSAAARRGPGLPDVGRLRIVLVSDAIPGRNGVGTYYDDLAQHLREHVDHVSVLSPPAGSGGPGWRIPMPGDPTQSLHVPPLRRLWAELGEASPHVIVVATPGAYGFLGMVKAARLRVPCCVAHHTELSKLAALYWDGWFGGLYRRTLTWWSGVMLRRGTLVLVHNEELVDAVRRRGARSVELVGTPIPRSFLERPLAPLDVELRRVSFVGRLAPEKELGQVMDAAREHGDLHFRVVGDGPLRQEVEARAEETPNLEAVGWIERDDVLALLDETDLLVLPSRYETFGSVALEAMVRRRPTLVSPTCGIVHWPELADGLFRMEPGVSLGEAIAGVRRMPDGERRAVAERGHRAAVRLNDRTISHWLRVLDEVVRDARAGA